jgi:hypothetical protein
MEFKTKITCILIFLTLCFNWASGQNKNQPEINVIHGEKHIFTIETPSSWINDKEYAKQIGLVCFFYSQDEIGKKQKNYFYANGIDKASPKETLDNFIKGDLDVFRKKYPEFKHEEFPVEFNDGLRNGTLYSFSNLFDRYKEEVLYVETDDSFLIFSFVAITQEDYEKLQPVFDRFISSFNYRGNNPKPFLEYMKNNQNDFK